MGKGSDVRRVLLDELAKRRRADWLADELLGETTREEPARGLREAAPEWQTAEPPARRPRRSVHLRLDPEVVDFFKAGGKGHLTRMQAVLRAYVDAQKRRRG